jgi:cytochrome bd-type quinol oxidase subunit 2
MRTFLLRALIILGLSIAVLSPALPVAAATDPFDRTLCSRARDSVVCKTPSGANPLTTKEGIFHRVTRIIATLAGIAAVIVMVVGGIRFITANGDAEQINKAKRTILYAAIGLVAIVVGQAVISFVINRI